VQVNGDTAVEPNETFFVNLSNATGNATITDNQGLGTIQNDDVAASNISINDVSAAEGNSGTTAFNFTVSLSAAQPAPVTVDFATADGTATAPGDYASGTGTVTFAPGVTSQTVTVQVNGDTTVESNETFFVNLSNATGNATITDNQGQGTIQNDDQPAISIDNQTVTEGGTANFTVSLDRPSNVSVTVDFATANNTAQAPGDYTAATGTLTFAPGMTTQPVSVSTVDDSLVEGTETFAVNLSNATNATIADATGVGTILDNDVAPSNITINDVSANEGNSGTTAFNFTVSLSAAQPAPVTVDFATADGTATAPSDYAAGTGTVTFAPGSTSQTVTVLVNGDTTFEPNETFLVNLSNAIGNATITDAQGQGTIVNDDAAPPVIDMTGVVIVNGPVTSAKTAKNFVFKVTNLGNTPTTINLADVTSSVDINGTATGSVSVAGLPVTIGPGASKRLKATWTYGSALATGNTVDFHACVNVAGDTDTTNDCDTATATAK
jgi:hypothetical protein